jgi:D-alanyl-D-alanine carboxypeptidase/D-alanyl-D-alanine-endopeptidase (penicillin-binding protein 4)
VAFEVRGGELVVRGVIPRSSAPWSDSCAHPDPVELFGRELRAELERSGITIGGATVRRRGALGGRTIATIRTPLAEVLEPINTHSMNSIADQLFLATARAVEGSATREAGARATRRALANLKVSTDGLVQVDGSGLSKDSRVSARQIAALIEAVLRRDERTAEMYRKSLAVAGEKGTLDDRMKNSPARGRVQAKTGFIAGTSALSGIAHALDGREYVFSILVNYPDVDGLNTSCWKPMQNELCELLVRSAP